MDDADYDPNDSLDHVVREHTYKVLRKFKGNKNKTAHALGISLKTLYNRMARWEVEGYGYGTETGAALGNSGHRGESREPEPQHNSGVDAAQGDRPQS
jgi:hypothetical protein